MRVVRFIDRFGQVRWGQDVGERVVCLARGDLLGQYELSDEKAEVARLLAPLVPGNIFCIGLNYKDHAKETGASVPTNPVIFMKPTSALNDPGQPIRVPGCCVHGPEVDFEGELAVVIGKAGRDIPESSALEHVLGYTCANDVSARRWQKQDSGGQWVRGKSFDTFCPMGPVLVTADDIPDPQRLRIKTTLNGRVMQDQTTGDMIFPVAKLISYLSQDTTLLPGTVILTGTPAGVGFARKPAVFLQPGDEVSVEIERIGKLTNTIH